MAEKEKEEKTKTWQKTMMTEDHREIKIVFVKQIKKILIKYFV